MKGTAGLFLTFPVKLLLNNPHRVGDTVITGAQNVSRIDALSDHGRLHCRSAF